MKAIVLLSAGIHPRSGAPMPVAAELQAIALARRLGYEVIGLHAGPAGGAVANCLGHGLEHITWLNISAADDPLAAISAELTLQKPDLVLAGRRGQGGADTGMLPYRVARAGKIPIAADAVAITPQEDRFAVLQALPRGARRLLSLSSPAVITVHESAPPAMPFVYRARLTGRVSEKPGLKSPAPALMFEERPYRRRPKLIGASQGSAEERLRAATEQKSAGGKIMINPPPAEAAAAILDYLARVR